ncbi:MAG TPA: zf-HC2 domain-containing protein [Thermoanaerobaculia bacterium]|nr:zf-HC2 domain-containing protein [Thermoanaerobaculia bacterium]
MTEQAHDPEQQIAERYFLGELDDAQAEAFEAHYFECASCAEYVVETQMLLDGGRQVVYGPAPKPAPQPAPDPLPAPLPWRPRQWMQLAAAAILAVVLLQAIPRTPEQQPGVSSPESQKVEFSLNRAEVTNALTFQAGDPILFEVLVPQEASVGDEVVIRHAETQKLIPPAIKLTPEQSESPFFLVPSALPAGRYEVAIERADGNRRTRIATQSFEVRR